MAGSGKRASFHFQMEGCADVTTAWNGGWRVLGGHPVPDRAIREKSSSSCPALRIKVPTVNLHSATDRSTVVLDGTWVCGTAHLCAIPRLGCSTLRVEHSRIPLDLESRATESGGIMMSTRRIALFLCGSFLAAILTPAGVRGSEPRLAVDEFQEKLARISDTDDIQVARRPRFPAARRPASCAWPFTRPAATRSRASMNWRSSVPRGKENLALAERGAVASASSLLPGYPIHQIKHLNDGLLWKRPQLDRRDQRPASGCRSNCPNRPPWPAS